MIDVWRLFKNTGHTAERDEVDIVEALNGAHAFLAQPDGQEEAARDLSIHVGMLLKLDEFATDAEKNMAGAELDLGKDGTLGPGDAVLLANWFVSEAPAQAGHFVRGDPLFELHEAWAMR